MTRRSRATREQVTAVLLDFERRGLVRHTGKIDKYDFPVFEFKTAAAVAEFSKHAIWEPDKASYSDSELKILGHSNQTEEDS